MAKEEDVKNPKASETTAKKAEEAEERDEDEGEEDEDEAEEAAAPAGGAAKSAASSTGSASRAADDATSDEALPEPRVRNIKPVVPPPPAASLGKSVTAFMLVLLGLSAGFWFLGGNDPFSQRAASKWKVGQSVQVDITLDPRDDQKLSCAAPTEIAGKRCEYKSKTEKADAKLDDKTMLRPYTTVGGDQFLAAGLWSHEELEANKRPRDRFTVKCDLRIEGKVPSPGIRWDVVGNWNEHSTDWWAGALSNCKVQK